MNRQKVSSIHCAFAKARFPLEKAHKWDSNIPYDPTAKKVRVDGKYPAFIRCATEAIEEYAVCDGNVIELHPNFTSLSGFQRHATLEHEYQHVIQHYEVKDSDAKYKEDPLFYEKEACARQILRLKLTTELLDAIVRNLASSGMDEQEARLWAVEVFSEGVYPGVNAPRIKGR